MELIAEAEWLVSRKKVLICLNQSDRLYVTTIHQATHVLIDGIQNSIPDIVRGYLDLEADVIIEMQATKIVKKN